MANHDRPAARTRREFVVAVSVGVAASSFALRAQAQGEKLDPADDLASALSYTHASQDAERNCANCQFYADTAGAEWASCQIFADKLVKGTGLCSSWTPRG